MTPAQRSATDAALLAGFAVPFLAWVPPIVALVAGWLS
jgi:hypothetical protein